MPFSPRFFHSCASIVLNAAPFARSMEPKPTGGITNYLVPVHRARKFEPGRDIVIVVLSGCGRERPPSAWLCSEKNEDGGRREFEPSEQLGCLWLGIHTYKRHKPRYLSCESNTPQGRTTQVCASPALETWRQRYTVKTVPTKASRRPPKRKAKSS